ncbi:hypothetical protein [Chryseobacterium contaminans]|uniref:hypothetical protein n=1 Tax=Chryseobacterium contaminans TaxID=1423959 RepID=UPI00301983A7
MNKKIILRLLLVATVSLFFLNSCRTDEMMQEEKRTEREKIEAFVRFENNLTTQKNTQKNNSEYISYHKPFQQIIQAFLNKNPAFAQKFQNEVGDIYFELRSLTYGKTSKVIVYPIMKDDKVNAFIIGAINPQRDWVNFTVAKDDTPEVQRIISKFQNYYNSASVTSRSREKEQPIEEVVIIVDSPGPVTFPYVDHNGFGGGMSGGNDSYGGGSEGGGGGSTQAPPPQSPCEKSKNIMSKPDVQAKIKELKDQSKIGGEVGVKIRADGTTSETISGGKHEVDLGDTFGYQGGYHNHTPTGIKMFSPPDIIKMMSFSIAQPVGYIQDGFMGMFGSEKCSGCTDGYRYYNYMINFSGTNQELAGFLYSTQYDTAKLIKDYRRREKELSNEPAFINYANGELNDKGLEKLFFDTLKNMGLEGKVNLQKIEDSGQILNINLDSTGNSTASTLCP